MIRHILYLLLCIPGFVLAQEFQEISTGPGYSFQSYINLESGTQHQTINTAWDIAFSADGQGVGVFINESGGTGASAIPPVALYDAQTNDFSQTPDTSVILVAPLYNDKTTWANGAFNMAANAQDPFDFGWGTYDMQTHHVNGTRVFVIDIRGEAMKKIQIESLAGGVYTFKFANLDGSEEEIHTMSKGDYPDVDLMYFNLTSVVAVDTVEPEGIYDLIFARYTEFLDNPQGGDTIPYLLTGVLSPPGVQAVKVEGVDPDMVEFGDYTDQLTGHLTEIGHDWKQFDLGTFTWSLPEDRVYFVQTSEDRIWQIQFIDFEGSSTGTAVMKKTDLGLPSAVDDPDSPVRTIDIYPNPARSKVHVAYNIDGSIGSALHVSLYDMAGRQVMRTKVAATPGLNVIQLDVDNISPGIYAVRLQSSNASITRRLSVVR